MSTGNLWYAAQQYTTEHPDYEGRVVVIVWSTTDEGQQCEGYGYWARDGRTVRDDGRLADNGPCRACGRVYLDPVLTTGYRPDGRAGQPLSDRDRVIRFAGGGHTYVYARYCRVFAICPECLAALGLQAGELPRDETADEWTCDPSDYDAAPRPLEVCVGLSGEDITDELARIVDELARREGQDYRVPGDCAWRKTTQAKPPNMARVIARQTSQLPYVVCEVGVIWNKGAWYNARPRADGRRKWWFAEYFDQWRPLGDGEEAGVAPRPEREEAPDDLLDSFRRSWADAMAGRVRPVETLWDGVDENRNG